MRFFIVKDPQGRTVKTYGVNQDVTDRKQVELALWENEKELQYLFKSMITAFVLFESIFDEKGDFISYRFVYINDAYERITPVVKNEEVIVECNDRSSIIILFLDFYEWKQVRFVGVIRQRIGNDGKGYIATKIEKQLSTD